MFQTEFNLKDYLVHLENLVNIDSGSSTYAGLDRVAEYYATLYEEIDLHVKRFKPDHAPANCLEISNAPEADYYDILIVGHMDTVFTEGTVHERPFRIEGDYAYGPGVADMKAGLLSAYYIVKHLLLLVFWSKFFNHTFVLIQKCAKNQGCIKNSILHLQNPRKWNDYYHDYYSVRQSFKQA